MEKTPDLIARRYLISGRVQGVGFRAFAAHAAAELGLAGWVRNLSDGRVEALAAGPPERVAAFRARLWRGPALSRVDGVDESVVEGASAAGRFEMRSTR